MFLTLGNNTVSLNHLLSQAIHFYVLDATVTIHHVKHINVQAVVWFAEVHWYGMSLITQKMTLNVFVFKKKTNGIIRILATKHQGANHFQWKLAT